MIRSSHFHKTLETKLAQVDGLHFDQDRNQLFPMVNFKEVVGGVEWRVTVPEGSTVKIESEYYRFGCIALFQWFFELVLALRSKALGFMKRAWSMGVDDPRKAIHGLKVGLALSPILFFYYTRSLYEVVGGNAMWAIMTVVVILEFQVGRSLYKGINRATAMTTAGTLAIGIHWIASKSGHRVEPVILIASVFLLVSFSPFGLVKTFICSLSETWKM